MATLVQTSAATSIGNVDTADIGPLVGVVSGNYLYVPIVIAGGSPSMDSVTSDRSDPLTLKERYTTADSVIEIWRGLLTSSGSCTVTVTALSTIPGNSTAVVSEVQHSGTPVDGPSNTLASSAAATTLVLPTLTTTNQGIIFTIGRVLSNFNLQSWNDGFSDLPGAQLGRGLYGKKITTAGVSASPSAEMGSTESADSLTIAFYDALTIVRSTIFGSHGKVRSSGTFLANLDGTPRDINEPGTFYIGGKLRVTGDAQIDGTLTATIAVSDDSITNAKLAEMDEATIKGRANGAGTGNPTDLTADDVLDILDTATDPYVRTSALPGGSSTRVLTFIIDGDGAAISTGVQKAVLRVPWACTLTAWTLMADQTGSIELDVLRDTFANYPPTNADSIVDGNYPALSSDDEAEDTDLSDWLDVSLDEGDVLKVEVRSATTLTYATLILEVTV